MKRIVGVSFLEEHIQYAQLLGLDKKHVIVDRNEWEDIISFFFNHRELVDKIGEQRNIFFNNDEDELAKKNI